VVKLKLKRFNVGFGTFYLEIDYELDPALAGFQSIHFTWIDNTCYNAGFMITPTGLLTLGPSICGQMFSTVGVEVRLANGCVYVESTTLNLPLGEIRERTIFA
jgi:hypothetical protein